MTFVIRERGASTATDICPHVGKDPILWDLKQELQLRSSRGFWMSKTQVKLSNASLEHVAGKMTDLWLILGGRKGVTQLSSHLGCSWCVYAAVAVISDLSTDQID